MKHNLISFLSPFSAYRWLSKASVMPAGPESDCFIIVGVSRPKLAALFLSVMLISLFLTFHILYDSAVYSIQVTACTDTIFRPFALIKCLIPGSQAATTINDNKIAILTNRVPHLDNQPIVFPHRIHFPKTSRKLPQVSIISQSIVVVERRYLMQFRSPPRLNDTLIK